MVEKLSKPENEEVKFVSKITETSEKITKNIQLSIVIIGSAESGKSSVFKHLNRNYNDFQFTEKEYIEFRDSIYSNVLSATRTISRNLLENSTVSFDDPDNFKRATKIAEFCDKTTTYKRYYTSDQYTPEIHEMIVELWKENIMIEKFQNQHDFCEGLEYFLNRILIN
jgi:hypothetical protein